VSSALALSRLSDLGPGPEPSPPVGIGVPGPDLEVNPRRASLSIVTIDPAGLDRFSGFADLYDANRPSPPGPLGPLLAGYANCPRPVVVDLGSGTGLSSRWAASWAASVTAIEPNDEMRAVAKSRPVAGVEYRAGRAEQTGLPDACADVALAVQAMHWMEPQATLAEVGRILRPGGVLAVVDADWPPVVGVARAERAWAELHKRIRVLEARVARGETADQLRRPITPDDPTLTDDDLVDPHRNRVMPGGLRSWSKSEHLQRMASSGRFSYTREVVLSEAVPSEAVPSEAAPGEVVGGAAERFKRLLYSQGSYQGLLKAGLSDEEIGAREFAHEVDAGFAETAGAPALSFCWRARIGITPR
jgi:SAM-dependent methyltransferase